MNPINFPSLLERRLLDRCPRLRRAVFTPIALALGVLTTGFAHGTEPAKDQQKAQSTEAPVRIALIEGLSGPFGNTGNAVARNLRFAVERINARGGLALKDGHRRLELVEYDNKGAVDESLTLMQIAADTGASAILQGNSSAVATALSDALSRLNARSAPQRRMLFLNYAAVDPQLTNEACSFWHFRFDAHADMRMKALAEVMREDTALKRVYLIGQDYSFGRHVLEAARRELASMRPDIEIAGESLHPIGKVKDFMPYVQRIIRSGAGAIVTGNWGNDLTLLVRAARDAGFEGRFYTFYGNALGVPGTLGAAGVGRVVAVAEWHPNVGDPASESLWQDFRARWPRPEDDYLHLRMQQMLEAWAAAAERAGSVDAREIAKSLEGISFGPAKSGASKSGSSKSDSASFDSANDGIARQERLWQIQPASMRAADHQWIQPMYASVMAKAGSEGAAHDVEGSGYGFRTLRRFDAAEVTLPTNCAMKDRPADH